jgi:dihydrofolate reductase
MARIVVSANVSLDGVVQDPTGDEGFERGGWFGLIGEDDRAAWALFQLEEALRTEALLLGRRSYEWFASRWPSRTGSWADRLNSMPKYVVSSTLAGPAWNNTTVLKGGALDEISDLKQDLTGEIVVYASFQLVHTLLEFDLVDELRLMVHPFVLGAGARLFGETSQKCFRLLDTRPVGTSLASLTYEAVRRASLPARIPAGLAAPSKSGCTRCPERT